ncbi:MAG TPA: HepT-like ribonuclease domain-containing protein [bacterium]
MPSPPDDNRYLWHMLEHATHVQYIVLGIDFDTFQDSTQVRLAIERAVDIIGRAAGRISGRFKTAHREIPWQRIATVAGTLAYPEGEPNDELVWDFLRGDLPGIMETLEPLIQRLGGGT